MPLSKARPTLVQPLKSQVALHACWFCYVLLLLMMISTSLPGQISADRSIFFVLSVKLLPLLLVLPGMINNRQRAFLWLCFIVLFYFTQSVVEAFLSHGSGIDLFITALTVGLFLSAMLYIKWQRPLGRTE